MKKQGFTLAEVLITLGIIGVVAALTIPTLIANSEKKSTVVKLKKFYTTFSQGLAQYAVDNSCAGDLKCTGVFMGNGGANTNKTSEELVKYFAVAQNCKMLADGNCFTLQTKMLNGNTYTNYGNVLYYKFITIDGMSVSLYSTNSGNCDTFSIDTGSTVWGSGPLESVCGQAMVDVNGLKAPNQVGRDTFSFFITGAGVLIPFGVGSFGSSELKWNGTSQQIQCDTSAGSTSYGRGCAGRIMEEGWEMNY